MSELATELLHEIKLSAKRWFIAFCAMLIVEVLTIAIFIWYLNVPTEELAVQQEATDSSYNIIGDEVYNGVLSDDNLQKTR